MFPFIYTKLQEWMGIPELRQQMEDMEKHHLKQIQRLHTDLAVAHRQIHKVDSILAEHTRFAADVSLNSHDRTFVIFAGKYKNRDYVNCYYLSDEVGNNLVPMLRDMSENYDKRIIDTPPQFKQFITHDDW